MSNFQGSEESKVTANVAGTSNDPAAAVSSSSGGAGALWEEDQLKKSATSVMLASRILGFLSQTPGASAPDQGRDQWSAEMMNVLATHLNGIENVLGLNLKEKYPQRMDEVEELERSFAELNEQIQSLKLNDGSQLGGVTAEDKEKVSVPLSGGEAMGPDGDHSSAPPPGDDCDMDTGDA